ncbi:alpha/beta fold hydrolase, partial [Candidatus Woesearchaeota archaeon]|nr:alpha/beta fold hydrolase [Candidatus Woesearchaeota archaeon]
LAPFLSQPPYNYHVRTVGQVLGQGGLYPNNGDITSLAKQLEAATEKLGVAKVDVIAHSMGGLVTRRYMTSNLYPSNIRNFIMLGTPNAGAPIAASPVTNLARFFGLIRGDDPKDTGRYQMHPRSTFLTHLNANFLTQGATINAIAGTKLNPVVLLASPSYLFRVTDSIVPRSSVRLAGLNCYSTPVTHSPQLGITYTNHQDTIDALVSILEGRPRLLPSCPESFSAAEQNTVQSTVIHGTITSQQVLTLKTLPLNKPFTGMLNWTSAQGQLALEFISPQGVSINVSSYQNVLNVSYSTTTLEDQTYEAFVFEQPSPGLWTIKVHAPSITAPTGFSFTLFAESTISLEVTTDKSSYKPLDPLLLTAQLLNNSVPVLNARVTAFITKPDTTIAQLQMFDDGLHNDGAPNDGVYGNQFTGTSLEGTYPILVRVPLEDAFVIEESALAFVERLPDLDVQASNVQITPGQLTLGQNATINIAATIRNIGDKEAQNVTVYFYDGDPAEYGEELGNVSYSSVPVNGVIQPSTSFLHIAASDPTLEISGTANLTATINISVADHALRSHDIYVLAELDGLEANTTNNLVHKQVGFGAVPYVVALSLGNAGIPLGDGRVIPLSYDGIFEISLYYPLVLGLAASQGVLDDEGKATATWTIPNIPLLVGLPFHVGFVTLDTTQQFPGLIYSISAEEPIVIQP